MSVKRGAIRKNVPKTCADCIYFDGGNELQLRLGISFCTITNEQTDYFINPIDRCVPRPTKCPYNPM
ncbi:MAG: hypothetical protein K0Q53_122 [Massilibacillus sp.]|jgi:hypothetical protein|nr:hypothetical protein [Massilibacillus sp.]